MVPFASERHWKRKRHVVNQLSRQGVPAGLARRIPPSPQSKRTVIGALFLLVRHSHGGLHRGRSRNCYRDGYCNCELLLRTAAADCHCCCGLPPRTATATATVTAARSRSSSACCSSSACTGNLCRARRQLIPIDAFRIVPADGAPSAPTDVD